MKPIYTPMKLSSLRDFCERMENKHGDLEVIIEDADTDWLYHLIEKDITVGEIEGQQRVKIAIKYFETPNVRGES